MFLANYDPERGWHDARVVPHGPITLDPAAAVFHYGQAMFEGLKAFRGGDGQVRLFRADAHCDRLAAGAGRVCMPVVPPELMLAGLHALVDADRDWVPTSPGTSLYLRPTVIGTEGFLGVRPSQRHTLFVISSPVGAYYAEGMNPLRIWVEGRYVRACRGGLGAVKAGANYAASLVAAEEAKKQGYAQVLWLDAHHHRELEEVGTMNVFVRIGDEIITPPLSGSILAGITRDCALTLLRGWGIKTTERAITIEEVAESHLAGKLLEVFGTGTAAVICPVGELGWKDSRLVIGGGGVGEMASRLYSAITAIQYGLGPDIHGWTAVVEPHSDHAAITLPNAAHVGERH
jgi:branched-chain amino acid aminotransferase